MQLTTLLTLVAAFATATTTVTAAPMPQNAPSASPLTDAQKVENGKKLLESNNQLDKESHKECPMDQASEAFKECQKIFKFKRQDKLTKEYKGKVDDATWKKFMQDRDRQNTEAGDIKKMLGLGGAGKMHAMGKQLTERRAANAKKAQERCGADVNSDAVKECRQRFFFAEDKKLIKEFKGKVDKATWDKFMKDKDEANTQRKDIKKMVGLN
jgi:hypothetical protein